jgi:hypothetical protein
MKEAEPAPGVAQVLEKTIRDAVELLRAEIAVAKTEAIQQVRSVARSGLFLAGGVMFLQAAITLLGVVLVIMLHDTALRLAVVGGFVAIVVALGLLGIRGMKRHEMHSGARLKLDGRAIAQAVK